jgi:hypothetical protein
MRILLALAVFALGIFLLIRPMPHVWTYLSEADF